MAGNVRAGATAGDGVKTSRSPFAYARALNPGGIYVTVGGSMPRVFQCLLAGAWIARTRNRRLRVLGLKPNGGLDEITTLVEAGKIVPHIGEVCALRDVHRLFDALARSPQGKDRGCHARLEQPVADRSVCWPHLVVG